MLIKPASGNCNLRCKYCFYNDVAENRATENYGIMKVDTLEKLVQRAFDYAENAVTFAFQGGEPTLAGLDFYKNLIEFERKYNKKNIQVNNAIQTNGMVIDDKWAKFLADNKFLVGLSLDGPKEIHDTNRTDSKGKGSFNKVMNTVQIFDKYNVEYNILFVVNAFVARHISKIYNFFRKHNFGYIQFIPCQDPLNEKPGQHAYSLTPERYAEFLKKLFDLWYGDFIKRNMVSVRMFDNYVGMLMGYKAEACGMLGECMCQFVVEADGGVYPCDFYVIDEWYLGNLLDSGLAELRESESAQHFIETSRSVDLKCKECKWFGMCRGGCRRTREPFEHGKPVLNYHCASYMEFFEYAFPRMKKMAQILSKDNYLG
jgi:uncharacterized protein